MKSNEVPQDKGRLKKLNLREINYAVDKDGRYAPHLSSGWQPKSIALDITIEQLKEQIEEAKQKVFRGEKSPIYYFMWREKMDISLLANYVEQPKWRIKRHFKPNLFKKLKPELLEKYADIFNIDVQELTNFNARNKV